MYKQLKKVNDLEERAEGFLLKMYDIFKDLKSAVSSKNPKKAAKLQKWEGTFERREWRAYNQLVSKLNKLIANLPEEEQHRVADIETVLEINEKNLADELSRSAGELNKALASNDWGMIETEIENIGSLIESTEAIFRDQLVPELDQIGSMLKERKKILLVEDKEANIAAAKLYFSKIDEVDIIYVKDYTSAMHAMRSKISGVITDCFFPKETGSADTSLGVEVIEKIKPLDPSIKEIYKKFEDYIEMDDELKEMVYRYTQTKKPIDITKDTVYLALAKVSNTTGRAAATHIAKNSLKLYSKEGPTEYHLAMGIYLKKSPYNQALGVLIAERAVKLGIPVVLATDTNHHGAATQPITDYASKNRWPLIDDVYGLKTSQEFWRVVYEKLKRLMR